MAFVSINPPAGVEQKHKKRSSSPRSRPSPSFILIIIIIIVVVAIIVVVGPEMPYVRLYLYHWVSMFVSPPVGSIHVNSCLYLLVLSKLASKIERLSVRCGRGGGEAVRPSVATTTTTTTTPSLALGILYNIGGAAVFSHGRPLLYSFIKKRLSHGCPDLFCCHQQQFRHDVDTVYIDIIVQWK